MSTELPEIKYAIGDRVWHATTTQSQEKHPCPDCLGTGKWDVKSPAGTEAEVDCPRCKGHKTLSIYSTAPDIRHLTIGSIKIDTDVKVETEPYLRDPVQYMCPETGVGSGTLYYQQRLFATKDEATAAAMEQVERTNAKLDAKDPKRAALRDLYHYQILDAKTKQAAAEANEYKWRWQRLLNQICELGTHPVVGGCYELQNTSLTEEQVEIIQKSLVCYCKDSAELYDRAMADKEEEGR